jgi:23S rRNA (adenine2503-C2)-methyltransferase
VPEKPRDPRPALKDWSFEELGERCVEVGWPRYRAAQIAAWIYARGVEDPLRMTDLPAELRSSLAERWRLRSLEFAEVQRSVDGTVKARLRGDDGAEIESVLIPQGGRNTLCVSTQVGCPLACSFCATGALGFRRNLRVAEIVDQVCRMRELLPDGEQITNLVFMGMGEPLLNRAAVVRAIRNFQEPRGFAFGARKITVSTAGVVPQIEALLDEVDVNLAVSLHATTDTLRDQLVPINRSFPLGVLLGAVRKSRHFSRRRPVFFEYTLMAGVNDAPAPRLAGAPAGAGRERLLRRDPEGPRLARHRPPTPR